MTTQVKKETNAERFQRLWLNEYQGACCMWQAPNVHLINVESFECWLHQGRLYIIQFWRDDNGFIVFKQELE
jgi:hypothetical protein